MKTYAIARNTFSESVRQPIIYLILVIGTALLLLSFAFTLFTFSDENTVRMIKDMGIATITLCALLVALFTASGVISDEIEKKTALTVLCKPVSRLQFVVGKYIGIVLLAACVILLVTCVFLVALWLWESRVAWEIVVAAMFSFLQVAVLTAISVAISTRFPLVVNVALCFLLYVVGNASSYFGSQFADQGAAVRTCVQVVLTILPNLECLNVASLAAKGEYPSALCLFFCFIYTTLYVMSMLALAFISLERRELL